MNRYLQELLDSGSLPVIFDYDGVLFEARWYRTRINMPDETEEKLFSAMERGENLYTSPIPFMIKLVPAIRSDIFVLSHIHNRIEYEYKCRQIAEYYPVIPQEHILWAHSPESKTGYMQKILETYGGFIYIDDTHPNLVMFENTFDDRCRFFHVSSLYV